MSCVICLWWRRKLFLEFHIIFSHLIHNKGNHKLWKINEKGSTIVFLNYNAVCSSTIKSCSTYEILLPFSGFWPTLWIATITCSLMNDKGTEKSYFILACTTYIKSNNSSVLDELNEKVQFSSKVRFLANFELNLAHFSQKNFEMNESSIFCWTWTELITKFPFVLSPGFLDNND